LLPHPGQQPPLHLGRGYKRYAAGHCRRRKQLWDCRQLHLPGRLGCSTCQVQEGVEGIARLGSRAAATVAIRRAASCAVVPPGRFTFGTDELCSSRRLASRRVCCARLRYPRARVHPSKRKVGRGRCAPASSAPHTVSNTLFTPRGAREAVPSWLATGIRISGFVQVVPPPRVCPARGAGVGQQGRVPPAHVPCSSQRAGSGAPRARAKLPEARCTSPVLAQPPSVARRKGGSGAISDPVTCRLLLRRGCSRWCQVLCTPWNTPAVLGIDATWAPDPAQGS